MDERKIQILNAIINSYIASPVPVGSRKISKEFDLGVSSATIRNEMSDLEDLGFLNKPHTSAGRVPSDKAYRFYVDEWLEEPVFPEGEDFRIPEGFFENPWDSPSEMYRRTAQMLADLTHYTAYVLAPKKRDTVLSHIELYPLDTDVILLLIIGNEGIVEKSLLRLEEGIPPEQLSVIKHKLNRGLTGINFSEIGGLSLRISGELAEYKEFIGKIVELSFNVARKLEEVDVYLEGLTNLLGFEEYQDMVKARKLLHFLEKEENLLRIFPAIGEDGEIHILIGQENTVAEMKENSLIGATYGVEERLGQVGLIGPMRMDYIPLMELVGRVSREMTRLLDK